MRRATIVLAIAMFAVVPARAGHGSETRSYVAGTGDSSVLLCSERPSLGGACFDVPAGHTAVRVRILDKTALPVGGALRIEGADGESLVRGSFCSQATVAIPAGAKTLTVFVDSARSPLSCPAVNGQIPGTGTTGDITVAWLSA